MRQSVQIDFAVVGSGIAGLTISLLAAQHGRVALLTKGMLRDSNSSRAQGGIAAALAADDNPLLHQEDTRITGQELCDSQTVSAIVDEAPDVIRFLQQLGVPFDCDEAGNLCMGREGAHSRRRIVHAGGDATGRLLVEALLPHVARHPHIDIWEHTTVLELLTENGECSGLLAKTVDGQPVWLQTRAVVLATGGLGQLFQYTTNVSGSLGDGFALAYRAGAVLRDMEFVQFHPTALRTDSHPLPLISEAVRGDGAILVNANGERFMHRYDPRQELASRDVVARAIYAEMQTGQDVFLDARAIPNFSGRFPTIYQSCHKIGLDPSTDLLPIAPAAHYTMGGIQTDAHGRTSVNRLFAIGEAASSGLHGANRLASNSLLEGLVMARLAAQELADMTELSTASRLPKTQIDHIQTLNVSLSPWLLKQVQTIMWTHVGIVRNEADLIAAWRQIANWMHDLPDFNRADHHLLTAARLVVEAALWRKESRGAHYRSDFPEPDRLFKTHSLQVLTKQFVQLGSESSLYQLNMEV